MSRLDMSRLIAERLVKNAGALGWSEVGTGEAALIQRCNAGEESACAQLVASHERMVFQLALHLLGDRDRRTRESLSVECSTEQRSILLDPCNISIVVVESANRLIDKECSLTGFQVQDIASS